MRQLIRGFESHPLRHIYYILKFFNINDTLLLGNFVKKNIGKFTDSELKDLENLLEIDDEILQKWFFGKNNENLVPLNKISKMFKEFKS